MIEKLFEPERAPFVAVRDGRLHVGERAYDELAVQIHEVLPVRKRFVNRRLECYSLDCRQGRNGRLCELCAERRGCSRRLQLRLAYRDGEVERPAILEIPVYSFKAFDAFLAQVGAVDRLPDILTVVTPVKTRAGWTNLEFKALF